MIDVIEVGEEVGYIVVGATGALYTNQVGGYACRHPEVEGRYVAAPSEAMQQEMDEQFVAQGGPYQGWCCEGITEATADWLDGRLVTYGLPLRVDRARLEDSMEAWVSCVTPDGDRAILTWMNSD